MRIGSYTLSSKSFCKVYLSEAASFALKGKLLKKPEREREREREKQIYYSSEPASSSLLLFEEGRFGGTADIAAASVDVAVDDDVVVLVGRRRGCREDEMM